MKISPRASALALTATALLAISACGGSDSSSEAAPRTKNAALPNNGATITKPNQYPSKITLAPKPTTTLNPNATPTTTPTDAPTTTVDLAVNTAAICTAPATTIAALPSKEAMITKPNQYPSKITLAPKPTTTLNPNATPTTTPTDAPTTAAPTVTTIDPKCIPSSNIVSTTIAPATTAATTAPSTTEFKDPNFTKPTTCSLLNRKLGKC